MRHSVYRAHMIAHTWYTTVTANDESALVLRALSSSSTNRFRNIHAFSRRGGGSGDSGGDDVFVAHAAREKERAQRVVGGGVCTVQCESAGGCCLTYYTTDDSVYTHIQCVYSIYPLNLHIQSRKYQTSNSSSSFSPTQLHTQSQVITYGTIYV